MEDGRGSEVAAEQDNAKARREFLKTCGKFAIVTPPVVTALMSSASANTLASGKIDPAYP